MSMETAGADETRLSPREWALLLLLATVQFTHIVDFVIMMPLGPKFHLTTEQYGLVVAAYSLSASLSGLISMSFLDRFGRKQALLVVYAGFTAGTLLCAFAEGFWPLLAARTFAGGFGGVVASTILAIVGDAFPDRRRGTATSIVLAAFSVASIFGLPLGLMLADAYNWQRPFLVLGGLSAAVLVLIAALLPPFKGHTVAHRRQFPLELFTQANYLRAYALSISLVFSSFLVVPFLATFLVDNQVLTSEELKYVYLCGGVATLVTMTYFGRLTDRFGKLLLYRILALTTIIPLVTVTNLGAGLPLPVVLAVTTLVMITTSGRMVPATALLTSCAAPRLRGGFMSVNTTVQHFAMSVATSVAGFLVWRETDGGPIHGYALTGLLACAFILISLYLAGRLRPAVEIERVPEVEILSQEAAESATLFPTAVTPPDDEEDLPRPEIQAEGGRA